MAQPPCWSCRTLCHREPTRGGCPRAAPLLLLPALGISPWGSEQRVQERSPCPCVVCWLCTEPLSAALQPARPAGTALSLGLHRKGSFPC